MPAYVKCNGLSKLFPFDKDSQLETESKRHFTDNSLVALENISFELEEGDVLGVHHRPQEAGPRPQCRRAGDARTLRFGTGP